MRQQRPVPPPRKKREVRTYDDLYDDYNPTFTPISSPDPSPIQPPPEKTIYFKAPSIIDQAPIELGPAVNIHHDAVIDQDVEDINESFTSLHIDNSSYCSFDTFQSASQSSLYQNVFMSCQSLQDVHYSTVPNTDEESPCNSDSSEDFSPIQRMVGTVKAIVHTHQD